MIERTMKHTLHIASSLVFLLFANSVLARQYEQGTMPANVVIPAYPAVERDGMLLSLKGWSGRTTAESGPNGLTLAKTFSISVAVRDPSNRRPVQVIGPVRLSRLADEADRDLAAGARITMSDGFTAFPTTVTSFVPKADASQNYNADGRPQNVTEVRFSLSPCKSVPSMIKELSGEVRVAVPADVVDHPCLVRASEEWVSVTPEIAVRIDSLPQSVSEYQVLKGSIRFKHRANADGTTSVPSIVNVALQDREPDTMARGSGATPARLAASTSLTESGSLVTFELTPAYSRPNASFEGKTLMLTVANSIDYVSLPFKFTSIPIGVAASDPDSPTGTRAPATP